MPDQQPRALVLAPDPSPEADAHAAVAVQQGYQPVVVDLPRTATLRELDLPAYTRFIAAMALLASVDAVVVDRYSGTRGPVRLILDAAAQLGMAVLEAEQLSYDQSSLGL